MLPKLTQKTISLNLTPMQLSEAFPQAGLAIAASADLGTTPTPDTRLVLHPGEPSRLSVHIQNWETYPLRLQFRLEGTVPLDWCRVSFDEQLVGNRQSFLWTRSPEATVTEWQEIEQTSIEISPKSSLSGELLFLVPKTFFEQSGQERFKLDFEGCLSVYGHTERVDLVPQLLQQVDFNLSVRPDSNYVSFLPVLYREVDFISRFIKIFEQAFEPIVNSFTSMWANLDPLTAPEALLPFVSHWVAWESDSSWDLHQQRRLIKRAIELYRWRGTRKGLRLYLHLYTGLPLDDHLSPEQEAERSISITEPFQQGFELGASRLGVDAVLGGGQPFHFNVRLRSREQRPIDETLVRRIIDAEKPAFCTYELIIES
ncbi:phage tail protein [Pseudanabaenaceae cyanobacterium LEGE 13415]|nr:phage tail protein [Pseudanabaenaceae cyanobacterium LEGE 13415]